MTHLPTVFYLPSIILKVRLGCRNNLLCHLAVRLLKLIRAVKSIQSSSGEHKQQQSCGLGAVEVSANGDSPRTGSTESRRSTASRRSIWAGSNPQHWQLAGGTTVNKMLAGQIAKALLLILVSAWSQCDMHTYHHTLNDTTMWRSSLKC